MFASRAPNGSLEPREIETHTTASKRLCLSTLMGRAVSSVSQVRSLRHDLVSFSCLSFAHSKRSRHFEAVLDRGRPAYARADCVGRHHVRRRSDPRTRSSRPDTIAPPAPSSEYERRIVATKAATKKTQQQQRCNHLTCMCSVAGLCMAHADGWYLLVRRAWTTNCDGISARHRRLPRVPQS